jgi:hypothetical protein
VATGSTASTYQTVLGIAKEPQPATGVPVAATAFVPVKKLEPENKPVKLTDESWRGSMVQVVGVQAGPQSSEVSLGGDVFADTIGWWLAGTLGDVVTTGASAPFTHTMSLLNSGNGQPTSYTLTDSDPLSTRQYASSRFTELTLKWDASELLSWEAKAIGWTGTTTTAPVTTFSTLPPVASWSASATLNAVALPHLKSCELSFKRDGSEPIFTVQNQQNPYEVHVGPITLEPKLTFIAKDEQPLIDLLANTTAPLVINYTTGAGPTLVQLQVTMTAFNYSSAKKAKGNSWIEWEAEGRAIGNVTDAGASGGYSPCKVLLKNALPASTYV